MNLTAFLQGATTLACVAIGIKFLKYWRLSRDRFFVWFAVAFWMFAGGWILRTFTPNLGEDRYLVFLPRLFGFLLILIAILDKNRRSSD
ncbi:MAG TPA: DUF5985 family protein [Kofleriaceae bacterium]